MTNELTTFRSWVKRAREALDYTQEKLASKVGCEAQHIARIESGARWPSPELATQLAEELKIAPEERPQFLKLGHKVQRDAVAKDKLRSNKTVLPLQLTSFVGRESEVIQIARLLERSEVRLVTLTGPAGTGKTRLSLRVATEVQSEFADGVLYVPLAAIRDPDLVANAIARALGTSTLAGNQLVENLPDYLAGKHLLLVIDNFEQVSVAAPRITNLLVAAPGLKILVTSRETLRVYGEYEFPVPPLPLPDLDSEICPDSLGSVPAIALFVERAQAAKPGFRLTADNVEAVIAICRSMDGLPLALELAAARIKTFTPQAMLARIQGDHRLKLLVSQLRDLPDRQQTLRNAIDWSYELLTPDEQALFRRLAVFAGGWTVEAAEAICNTPKIAIDTLEAIEDLATKSLITQGIASDGEPRFAMLETTHEYAWERLRASGEHTVIQRQHAMYYLRLVEEVSQQEVQDQGLLDRIDQEHDNLRALFGWAQAAGEEDLALRLSRAMWESGIGMTVGMRKTNG